MTAPVKIPPAGNGGTCRRCRAAPSTGVIFAYCDACFEAYEAEVDAVLARGEEHVPTDAELEAINPPFYKRSN